MSTNDANPEMTNAVTIENAYITAESGIAAPSGDSDGSTIPNQIYVEFSHRVTIDDANGSAVPADGFSLDGTIAGLESVQQGQTVGSNDSDSAAPGSRVLELSLSMAVTADEEPTLSYNPANGDVETATGFEPEPADAITVTPGSPRVVQASVPAGQRDTIRVTFDTPVSSRTHDTSMFTLSGGSDNGPALEGEISVDGEAVTLPLDRDLTQEPGGDSDSALTIGYRTNGSDTERMKNLVSESGAVVQQFSEPLQVEVGEGGFTIQEASVPVVGNGDSVNRSQVEVWFDPPMTAQTAAGYKLEGTLARITGLAQVDSDSSANAPHVVLELDAPIDPEQTDIKTGADEQQEDAVLRYSPERGDTRAAGGEEPESELSVPVRAIDDAPTARRASLAENGEAIEIEFSDTVRSQTDDATGFSVGGPDGVSLSGEITEGETVTLGLTGMLDLQQTDGDVTVTYTPQSDSATGANLLSAEDGSIIENFERTVERSDGPLSVKYARIPESGPRDQVQVRFDRPVSADSAAGFSLEESVARIEELTTSDNLSDSVAQYTVTLGLHVEPQSDSATLVYDANRGNVVSDNGERAESFEQSLDALPLAPVARGATVPQGSSEIRVTYDREVMLNHGDGSGFSLSYGGDTNSPPSLTGQAQANGSEIALATTGPIDPNSEPMVEYQVSDNGPNVIGAEEGVAAEAATIYIDGGGNAAVAEQDGETAELVHAEIPQDQPDRIICEFDSAITADAAAFEVTGTDVAVDGTVQTGSGDQVTLELSGEINEGENPVVTYDPTV